MQAGLCGFSLALAPNEACYVPLGHKKDGGGDGLFDAGLARATRSRKKTRSKLLKPLLEDKSILKIAQNMKYDWLVFAQRGIEIQGYDDTMLISYVLDAGKGGHGMDDLVQALARPRHHSLRTTSPAPARSQVSFDCVAIDKATEYAAEDADVTLRLWNALKPRLAAERVATVYETLERADALRAGAHGAARHFHRPPGAVAAVRRIRPEAGRAGGRDQDAGRRAAQSRLARSSSATFCSARWACPAAPRPKPGQWSTGARELEDLAEQGHALPRKILDWRQVSKLRSTYTEALPNYVNPTTHRVHTSYALAATSTGRLSSSDPNLQNIPIRTEEGRKIRRAFVAEPGMKLVSADYSQIELRLSVGSRRGAGAAQGVPGRRRHPRHDRVGNVRRAGQGHAERGAPPRQGDQFRHHLRHLGLRPRRPARHRQERGRRLHQEIFRALPRHPRLHGRDARVLPRQRLCAHAVRPQVPLPRHQGVESVDPLVQRARRDQRAPARLGRRHHPPRHDAHGGRTRQGQARARRCFCRCTTN